MCRFLKCSELLANGGRTDALVYFSLALLVDNVDLVS